MVEKCPANSVGHKMASSLLLNATDLYSKGFDFVTGGGLVDAASAVSGYQQCGSSQSLLWIAIAASAGLIVIVVVLLLGWRYRHNRRKGQPKTARALSTDDGASFHSLTFVETSQESSGVPVDDDERFPL